MKRILTWGGMGIASLLLLHTALAVEYTKGKDPMTFVVDQAFEIQIPGKKWDTQKVRKDPNAPLKWVLHQAGRDPAIQFKYKETAPGLKGRNLDTFASHLKKEYKQEGVMIEQIERKNINGQKVVLLQGFNPYKDERFLVGAWIGKGKGYILECSSLANDFTAMKPEFQKAINTAKLLKK